jgi:hypothetical protein
VSYIGPVIAGEKRSPWRGVLVIAPLWVFVVLVILGCGGGGGQSDQTVQANLPTVTAPSGVATTRPAQSSGPTAGGGQPEGAATHESAPSHQAGSPCGAGISAKQCKTLGSQQPQSGKPGKTLQAPKDCLAHFSRDQCEAMANAGHNGPGKTIRTPADCLQVMTRDQCEAMAKAQH